MAQRNDDRRLWPRVGVSTAVFRGGEVLLVERAKPPLVGIWSLPGGHVEPGEAVRDAALREVREETGLDVDIVGIADVHDVIRREQDGSLSAHYVLTVFAARWLGGCPAAASDCSNTSWVAINKLGDYPLTEGAPAIIRRALALIREP